MKKAILYLMMAILAAFTAYSICCEERCWNDGICMDDGGGQKWYQCACNTSYGALPPGRMLGACLQCQINSTGGCSWIANYSSKGTGTPSPCMWPENVGGTIYNVYYYCNATYAGAFVNWSTCIDRDDFEPYYCEADSSCKLMPDGSPGLRWAPNGLSGEQIDSHGNAFWYKYSYLLYPGETRCCGDEASEYPIFYNGGYVCCDNPDAVINITGGCSVGMTPDVETCDAIGLIAYYKFDEGQSNIAHDSTSNRHNGKIDNPWWETDGKIGYSIKSEGLSFINITPSDALQPNSLTYSAWIMRTEDWNRDDRAATFFYAKLFADAEVDQYVNGWYIESYYIDNHNKSGDPLQPSWCFGESCYAGMNFYVDGDNRCNVNKTPNQLFEEDSWTHLAVTFDDATNNCSIYVNGVSQNITKYGNPDTITPGPDNSITMMKWHDAFYNLWGELDEVSIWDYALSEAEILDIYSSGIGKGLCDYRCGNGIVELNNDEQCDDGDSLNKDINRCRSDCTLNISKNALIIDFNGPSSFSNIDWVQAEKIPFPDGDARSGWIANDIEEEINKYQLAKITTDSTEYGSLILDYQKFNSSYKLTHPATHTYNITYIIGGDVAVDRFNITPMDEYGKKQSVTAGPVMINRLQYLKQSDIQLRGDYWFNFTKENPDDTGIINAIILECVDCVYNQDSYIANVKNKKQNVILVLGVERFIGPNWARAAIIYNSSNFPEETVEFPAKGRENSYRHLMEFYNLGTPFSTTVAGRYRMYVEVWNETGTPMPTGIYDDLHGTLMQRAYSDEFTVVEP